MMVGTVPAGTTAYTIPKIDEYLKEQGFDKEVRDITLLALSAGIGATVGGVLQVLLTMWGRCSGII